MRRLLFGVAGDVVETGEYYLRQIQRASFRINAPVTVIYSYHTEYKYNCRNTLIKPKPTHDVRTTSRHFNISTSMQRRFNIIGWDAMVRERNETNERFRHPGKILFTIES